MAVNQLSGNDNSLEPQHNGRATLTAPVKGRRAKRARGAGSAASADPVPIGTVLQDWLSRSKLSGNLLPCRIRELWPDIVGAKIAARATPTTFRDGVLTIVVANHAWLNELHFLGDELRGRINERLGDSPVNSLRLLVGPALR